MNGREQSSEIGLHIYGQLCFDKIAKKIWWRMANLFNKWYWNHWISITKMQNSSPLPYTKINLNGLQTQIQKQTITFLEENIAENLCDFGSDKAFIDMIPQAQSIIAKIVNCTSSEFKTSVLWKTLLREQKSSERLRKYLQRVYFIKGLYLGYIKDS